MEDDLEPRWRLQQRMDGLIERLERARVLVDARPAVLDLAELLPEQFHDREVRIYPAVVRRWPDLAPEVRALRRDHDDILDRFGALVLEMPDDGAILPTAALAIPSVLRALRDCERAERDLLDTVRRRADAGAR